MHLANATASNSPSRRYAVILEELRTTASLSVAINPEQSGAIQAHLPNLDEPHLSMDANNTLVTNIGREIGGFESLLSIDAHPLDEWNTMDWLALDSSVSHLPSIVM
jgi:hypothetical protein